MASNSSLWQALKAFNLFRLLENETMDMFSMGERNASADKVREYFINPKVENEALD